MDELTELLKKEYSENVYIEIFKILKDGENYTKNLNGIFFNLKNIDISKIQQCIDYLKHINKNIEDHLEKITTREIIEKEYKNIINRKEKKQVKVKEKIKQTRREIDPKWLKPIKYTGSYARLDDVLNGRKSKTQKQKQKEKTEEIEEQSDEEEQEESDAQEDLFGQSSSEEDDKSIS